jgi:hypothetical protein
MDQVSESLNLLITNAKRDKKIKIPSEVLQTMQTLSNTVNTINETMAKINNDIQETRQQYVPPPPGRTNVPIKDIHSQTQKEKLNKQQQKL